MKPTVLLLCWSAVLSAQHSDHAAQSATVRYDGADWKLKGEGWVCCPCTVPCPCRSNGVPDYGHCERTLAVKIAEGHYGDVNLNGLTAVNVDGMCTASLSKLAAIYFDAPTRPEQLTAFLKIFAGIQPSGIATFPYIRTLPIRTQQSGSRFQVTISGILDMEVDRNWGQAAPPFPLLAGVDPLSNALQIIENVRYRLTDPGANLDFDYSHRQANYRVVNVSASQYRSKSMLVQFEDGTGALNHQQLELAHRLGLAIPDIKLLREQATRLKRSVTR